MKRKIGYFAKILRSLNFSASSESEFSQPKVIQLSPVVHFAENPQGHHCDFCNDNIVTKTNTEMGTGSWICVGVLLIFTGLFCCIPCLSDCCQDVVHSCPKCNRVMGKKKFMGL